MVCPSKGFRKIVKKFDKALGTDHQTAFVERLQAQPFCTSLGPENIMVR